MKSTKILALAALTALTFGVGGAMAQNSNPSAPYYGAQPQTTAPQAQAPVVRTQENTVQYGSSDHGAAFMPGTIYPDTDRVGGGF